jgi:hypothetical protein
VRGDTQSIARELNAFPDFWKLAGTTIGSSARARRKDRAPGYDQEDTAIRPAGAQGGCLTTSRRLEAARDSLTDGCTARILGDGDCAPGLIGRSDV